MHKVTIQAITPLNAHVFAYKTSKPEGYSFQPGQATEVAIAQDGWSDKKRPFTFTSLPEDEHLEFTIKSYPDHNGVTQQLSRLIVGDELMIDDPWGAIHYKGPGTFIAGGAGLTPFLAILRSLSADANNTDVNTLLFANTTERDIFCETDLRSIARLNTFHVLSQEDKPDHLTGHIDEAFLRTHIDDFAQNFYVCGPDDMVSDITKALEDLGANPESIVFESS